MRWQGCLTQTYVITANTTIDGGGHNINIFGLGNNRNFIVAPGVTLTLKNLTISNGRGNTLQNALNHFGGAILNYGGHLSINNVHFDANFADKGGAIYNYVNGTVVIQNSFFNVNSTPSGSNWKPNDGGAIYLEDGSLDVKNTTFTKNHAYDGGAIANEQADITITDSTFDRNFTQPTVNSRDNGDGSSTFSSNESGASGGAIYSAKPLTISNTKFMSNTASFSGGAIIAAGGILTNNTFTSNTAEAQNGGAIVNFGVLEISSNDFSSNQALRGEGGAIYSSNKSTLTLSHSTLGFNIARESGGAITTRGFLLQVRTSTLHHNDGGKQGGAIYAVSGLATLSNSTFYDNSADMGGALTTEKYARVEAINSTIAGNKAYTKSTIYNNGQISLKNTLVVNYSHKTNCTGVPVLDDGNNLQFPETNCGLTIPNKDPLLMLLNDNGGPTQTMALKVNSPAIDAGRNAFCSAGPIYNLDQRGYSRPNDGNLDNIATCDIGAFEYAALATGK